MKYPYEALYIKDLPDERWEDIRDFEGLYQVSNYGRIKSLERERESRWNKNVLLPERIMRPKLVKRQNKHIGTDLYTLMITLSKERIRYNFSIGRLVYDCFIERFDINDRSIFIGLRDYDGRNLRPENLYKTNISQLKSRSHIHGRSQSHLSVLSKTVTQFDEQGNPIAIYESAYEAWKKTGINNRGISKAANGGIYVFKGFFWRFGSHKKKLNISGITKDSPEVNAGLAKRIGIDLKDKDNVPPCLNLSLQTMKGERWKDIPGYEGYYQVSSYGRVKTMARISEGQKSRVWVSARIKKLTPDASAGSKQQQSSLLTTLTVTGHSKKIISVARMVYHCFCRPFDLGNSLLRIYYKDGNHFNLHYKNLVLKHASYSINK